MTTNDSVLDGDRAVLTFMRGLDARNHGYEVRGVRGWARAADVTEALEAIQPRRWWGAAEELRKGVGRRGYYDRHDVRVPGATAAVWVYRIEDSAARMVADLRNEEHTTVADPVDTEEERAYVSSTVAAALDAMRHAAEHPGRREWVPGESAWRTSLELTSILRSAGDDADQARVFMPGDLNWAVRSSLVEERRVASAVLYRLTPLGQALSPLQWHGPPPGLTRGPL